MIDDDDKDEGLQGEASGLWKFPLLPSGYVVPGPCEPELIDDDDDDGDLGEAGGLWKFPPLPSGYVITGPWWLAFHPIEEVENSALSAPDDHHKSILSAETTGG